MSGNSPDTNGMNEAREARKSELLKAVFLLRARARARSHPFSCFLDELPSGLAPGLTPREGASCAAGAEYVVNAGFRFQQGDSLPGDLPADTLALDGLLRGYPLAWVEEPGIGIWTPFWVRGVWADVLQSLRPGAAPALSSLQPEVRCALASADILVARGHEQARRAHWSRVCATAREEFRARGYAVVRNLIPPRLMNAMRRYYRALVGDGDLPLGDSQVPGRYHLHSEVLGGFYHPQLTSLMSRVAGEEVKPSFVYFASYQPGAALPRHTDREQCEFSISLLADYVPDSGGPCGWPLHLENPAAPDTVGAVDLAVGDCVFYRGRELAHYRQPLPAGHQSSSLFLNYVRSSFSGQLW